MHARSVQLGKCHFFVGSPFWRRVSACCPKTLLHAQRPDRQTLRPVPNSSGHRKFRELLCRKVLADLGSSSTTSRKCRPSFMVRLQAASTVCAPSALPIFFASAIETASAKISPRVISRFCRMRSASTSNRGASLRHLVHAPAVSGQFRAMSPTPRASRRVRAHVPAASPRALCSQVLARASPPKNGREATGLRLCGMVDDPPRPSSAGSKTSAISVCDMQRNIACNFSERADAAVPGSLQFRQSDRDACATGVSAKASSKFFGQKFGDFVAFSSSAACVPTAPPNCSTRHAPCVSCSRSRWRVKASSQPATFAPKVVGSACCIQVRPTIMVERCSVASSARHVASLSRSAAMRSALRVIAGSGRCRWRPDWSLPNARSARRPCRFCATSVVSAFTTGMAVFPRALRACQRVEIEQMRFAFRRDRL